MQLTRTGFDQNPSGFMMSDTDKAIGRHYCTRKPGLVKWHVCNAKANQSNKFKITSEPRFQCNLINFISSTHIKHQKKKINLNTLLLSSLLSTQIKPYK